MKNTGMTNRIRNIAARINRQFSREDVFNAAGVPLTKKKSFDYAWNQLRANGELVRRALRSYVYDDSFSPEIPSVKPRIYRAMHVKGAFCVSDIAKLSDAHTSYVQRMVGELVLSGELEFTGKRGKVKFYRVRNSEKFYLDKVANGGKHGTD